MHQLQQEDISPSYDSIADIIKSKEIVTNGDSDYNKSMHTYWGLNLKLNINSPENNKQNKVNTPSTIFSAKNPYRRNPYEKNDFVDKNKAIAGMDAVKTIESMNDNIE